MVAIIALDSTLEKKGIFRKESISQHPQAVDFIKHCCQSSHYTFDILKCGKRNCKICAQVRLPFDVFQKLRHIPHPTPGDDGHYLPFSDVFGVASTEEHRPSFKPAVCTTKRKKRRLPYYASMQHVKNAQLMVQCFECNMWRLVFSKHKLKTEHRLHLQTLLDDYMYSCGSSLRELDLPEVYEDVTMSAMI